MASERIQRRVERLLDQAEEAADSKDWTASGDFAREALALDEANVDARLLLDAAEQMLGGVRAPVRSEEVSSTVAPPGPTSFANGRYEVKRFLGEGGKKRVYLAHDAQLDRDVAFALIKTEGLDEQARQRIKREAQAMGRLGSHPHIVTVYDIGHEGEQPYLVLPVLPGGDVEGVIEKAPDHRLSIEQAVKIASEVCLGLEFSHSKGIIHRDLKPGNVWLAEDGRAMIGDFGLAVAVDRSRLTQAGMMVGTVNYMPPEQAMGGEVTPQSDLYSLGAMLYEMVCGRPPFVGDEHVAIIGQHLNTPPVAPTWHRPDCPPGLEALILRLLEKDASRRPTSAAEVREALSNIEQGASVSTEALAPTEPVVDPLYRRTFVGRENETRQLYQAYDAAVSGQGGLVMIAGEPGIGKTALCEQLETYVSLRGGKTLFGHSYEEGSMSLPYLAFVEAMRTYVLEREADSLRSELGTGAGEVARIVSEVRDKVRVDLREASDPEDDRWRLLNAITTFLRNAALVQPLVIVLEDLHWADRGTLDLLLHVARNVEGTRLLAVGTYRDVEVDRTHPLSATLADLRRVSSFLRIPLRGLTVDEVHRMYEAIRSNTVPRGQAEAVHRATEGNPLFVQEILRYLVEEGLVVRQDGQYVATPGVAIPEGLRDVVGRRLGHLDQKTNDTLSVAAVIGRDFTLDVLQRVANLPDDELETALEEASARSIIEQRETTGSIGFRFTHAFFRQVLYEEIFAPRRIRWHQQVARSLEEVYSQRLGDHAAELAEHFAQSIDSEDLTKAVEYGELAAKRAVAVFAHGEATRHLEQAVRAQEVLDPGDLAKRCDLLLALGESMVSSGDDRALNEVAPAALLLAQQLSDDKRAFAACNLGMNSALSLGTPGAPTAVRFTETAALYIGDDLSARARLNRRLAAFAYIDGHAPKAGALLRETMELARGLDSPDAEFGSLWGLLFQGDLTLSEAAEIVDEFHSRPRAGVSTFNLAFALVQMILVHLANGDHRRGEELLVELETLVLQRRDATAQQQAYLPRRILSILRGELQDAKAGLDEIDSDAPGVGFRDLWSSLVAEYLGQPQPPIRNAWGVSFTGRINAALHHARDGALPIASDALASLLSELAPVEREIHAADLVHLLEVSLYLDDRVAIERLLSELRRRQLNLKDLHLRYLLPQPILRVVGDSAANLKQPVEARDYFEQNLLLCERIGHRPELALTRAHLAELLLDHYPDERDAAIEHLDFAIAEFQHMKMQPALEQALGRRGLLKA